MSTRKTHTANVVKSARPAEVDLTLYEAGNAVVHEQRTGMAVNPDTHALLFEDMPTGFVEGSLIILESTGRVGIDAITYRAADLSPVSVLGRAVGQVIKVYDEHGKSKSGVLERVCNGQIYLRCSGDGRASRSKKTDVTVVMPLPRMFEFAGGLLAGLSSKATLLLKPKVAEEETAGLRILYETEGLQWASTRYNAFYDRKDGRLQHLECWVELANISGIDFEAAGISLMTGTNVSRRSGAGYAKVRPAAMRASAASFSGGVGLAEQADVESVGEHKQYKLPGSHSLQNGESKWLCLLSAGAVPVVSEIYLPPARWYQAGDEADLPKQPLNVHLRLVNSGDNNLGQPLPQSDEFVILQADSSGAEQKTDTASIGAVAVGEPFVVELNNRSTDVKATRVLTQYHDDPVESGQEEEDSQKPHPLTGPISMQGVLQGGPGVGTPDEHSRRLAEIAESAGTGKKKEKKPRYHTEERQVTVYNFKQGADETPVEAVVYEEVPPGAEVEMFAIEMFRLDGSLVPLNSRVSKTSSGMTIRMLVLPQGKTTFTYTVKWLIA